MPNDTDILDAPSLDELNRLISSCKRCKLSEFKTKDVPGIGNEKAEIMFIGEAPGKSEDEQGEPFVGAAGKFLNEMLETIRLKRKDVFIANVLKHRPPENRDPLPDEIELCWPFLARQIEIISPKLIIFLGRHSLNRFFPQAKISEVHGKAFRKMWNAREQVFLALYHPAAALYNGSMKETLIGDFSKIPKILKKIDKESKETNTLEQTKLI